MAERIERTSRELARFRAVGDELPRERQESDDTRKRRQELEVLRRALAQLRIAAERSNTPLSFALDEDLLMLVVIVVEHGQRRVLRRIPAEEGLRLAEQIAADRLALVDRVL